MERKKPNKQCIFNSIGVLKETVNYELIRKTQNLPWAFRDKIQKSRSKKTFK